MQPKWGFLPSPIHLSPASLEVKTRHCRFCMHSSMKEMKGDVETRPGPRYCPLNLYSMEDGRMAVAVEALWAGWLATDGKANNLRIFLHGKRLSPAQVRHASFRRPRSWLTVVIPGRLRPFGNSSSNTGRRLVMQSRSKHVSSQRLEDPLDSSAPQVPNPSNPPHPPIVPGPTRYRGPGRHP